VLCARAHPLKAVAVGVHVLCDDGGAVAAAVNAAFLALVDAGVAMRAVLTAACVSVHNGVVVVDPERVEEVEADGVLTFTFDGGTDAAEGRDMVGVRVVGDVGGVALFDEAAAVARQLCRSTRGFIKLAVSGKADDEAR
jgi:exosome complex RNA-binding protein Rrp42 (RNase PH superfamily)